MIALRKFFQEFRMLQLTDLTFVFSYVTKLIITNLFNYENHDSYIMHAVIHIMS